MAVIVDPADPRQPLDALIPYEVAHSFWSDGAGKRRWMALPDGTSVTVGADGDWDFPTGTVLAKEFEHDGQLIETRLLMHHPDGTWGGYAYAWNESQTEAELVDGGLVVDLSVQQWLVPDSGEWLTVRTVVDDPLYLVQPFMVSTNFKKEADGATKWTPKACRE